MKRTQTGKRTVFLIALLTGTLFSLAQQPIQGKVVSEKGEPLPFTGILVKNSGKGFICNEDGMFIVNVLPSDTLLFRSVGYRSASVPVSVLSGHHVVRLSQDVLEISEVVIEPGDKYLYAEVLACRNALFNQPVHKSKAYYLLDGEVNGQPTE